MTADAMVDVLATFSKFPLPPNLPADLARAGRPLRPGPAASGSTASSGWSATTGRCSKNWPASKGVRDYLGERLDATSFAVDAAHPRRAEAGADRASATRPRTWPATPRGPRCRSSSARSARSGPAVPRPRLPARWPSTSSTPAATSAAAAASSSCRAARARPSSASPPWPLLQKQHAGPDHQHHRRQAVAPRDPRQDRPRRAIRSPSTPASRRRSRPVTLATYQILTYRPKKDDDFPHFELFDQRDWGLIIYDEVHLLPAPVFRVTAEIQARRRLGLTATLVREDGREEDVFSLIGPKKYDVPWRELETKGWIAEAQCHEVRVGLPGRRRAWSTPSPSWRDKFRLASENPAKDDVVGLLLEQHDATDDRVLIIGQYLKQLRRHRRAVRHPAHHRADAERRARGPVRPVPPRRGPAADPVEGRQLRHRPARRQRADPGLGHVRRAPGGGPAARAASCGRRRTASRPTSTRW